MNILKKYNFIYKFVIYIIILTFIETLLNLFIPINTTINQIITLISLSIYILICNIKKGKKTENKAYLEGFKTGLIYVLILYLLAIPFGLFKLTIKRIIFYVIIMIMSITSTIIGINKKTL